MPRLFSCAAAICLLLTGVCPATAAESSASNAVAARVDGQPVRYGRIQREVQDTLKGRPAPPEEMRLLEAQALEQFIGRRLVLRYLAGQKLAASEVDIRLSLEQVKKKLKTQETTLADYLSRAGLQEDEFREAIAWELSWQAYLEQHMTDANLQKFFEQHRRDFDGTQLNVAHILWKVDPQAGPDAWEAATKQATAVRAQITQEQVPFAQAALQNSQAPTARQGGNLGLISRHEPMPESFSQAAFQLQPGETSPPVTTAFGVHLIYCQRVQPGQRSWTDARPELETAVMRFLFDFVVKLQRPHSQVEYTGAAPHFDPTSGKLVPAQ
ncbi:peptidylprolyl isomerase [Lignipirellula cremea]|uniref:peptidylprolyl isomerase n=1 Tax=Lignipirellula cremea TaxID=2528010 RepID=A0A518DLY2_9BACT|nr:peptidylprolyl isomerase [Lignipirellula cremea]QDU92831.1 Foldase protein PrsA precursor [Lignipirellula cremea]